MRRRQFIATLAAAGAGVVAAGHAFGEESTVPQDTLPQRPYGKTGESLSIIGFGGIVVSEIPQEAANDIVAWAIDRGVNYFDVAPSYGNAEERLGPALQPYRDRAFLACKTGKRDAAGAREELEQSLRTLRTDHFDLYQLHGLSSTDDVDKCFAPGGAMEAFCQAQQDGKVRHIGFSAHSEPAALRALELFSFASVLFPFNVVCFQNGHFGPELLKVAQRKEVALLALKAMALRPWEEGEERIYPKCWYRPIDEPTLAGMALRYTLDKPIVAAIPPGDAKLFKMAVEQCLDYTPLTPEQRLKLSAEMRAQTPLFSAAV